MSDPLTWSDDFGAPQTTAEFWDVDGHGLSTLAYNIETLTGRVNVPIARGTNVPSGNRPGARWVQKPPDQRKITMAMWVRGSDLDGVKPPQPVGGVGPPTQIVSERQKFNDNVRTLQRLFAVYDRQIEITRRTKYPEGVLTVRAMAECTGDMTLDMKGPTMAAFTVDLLLADPFWYEDVTSAHGVLTPMTGIGVGFDLVDPVSFGGVSNYDLFLPIGGDQPAYPVLSFNGPVSAPAIDVINTGQTWRWMSGLSAGQVLIADMKDRTVTVGGVTRFGEVDRSHDDVIAFPPDETVQVRFRADAYNAAASLDVAWRNVHN